MDLFCVIVPLITEGFGFSAAETCALGKPIIASDGEGLFARSGFGEGALFPKQE